MAILMIAFTGCSKDTPVDNPDNPSNPETPVNVVMQNVALTGLVKDASGNPLSGVKVTTGTANATTGSDGKFSFTQAGTVDDRAVIKFEKSGYFTLTRSGDKEDEMYMNPVMYRKGNDSITLQTSFDASAAKTLQLGGVKIDLPAGCMAKADGSAYSGTVRADVLNLGSGNANTALMIPGGDLATDKSDEMMLPIGMVDVIFTDNAGNLLKIKDKTDVKMSWPAPSGATSLPSSISLWTFDEARGIWLEEGSAMLQGNVYTGTVSHFTPKGAGKRSKTAIMQIHATECDNKPAAGAKVTFYDVDDDGLGILDNEYKFLYETYFTNSAGDCSVKVPINWKYWTVYVSYKGENQRQEFTQGNMGGQGVYFKFENGCNGNLTFNLKPGPTSDSFIIECVPAMPVSKTSKQRFNPSLYLLDPSEAYVGFIFKTTECTFMGLDYTPYPVTPIIINIDDDKNWNNDFTEYKYVISTEWYYDSLISPLQSTWSGTVQMEGIAPFSSWPEKTEQSIKSIKIGSNNPLSLHAETK